MIWRASGGALYHWRAWRRHHTWREFSLQLEDWLSSWKCPHEELLLLGPSGGYTLPTAWLKKFASIKAFDLDPLAPLFFRHRHRRLNISFFRRDVFWKNGRLTSATIAEILRLHPRATILFANVIGQLLLEGKASENEWLEFLKNLRGALANRAWASYHDTFTHEGGEVIDHLTSGDWKKGLESRGFRWPLSGRSLHEVEGVRPA